MVSTREEKAAQEQRWDKEAAWQKQVHVFERRLKRLEKANDHRGVIALWDEFEAWCDENAWPDQWRNWERAAEDALLALQREEW